MVLGAVTEHRTTGEERGAEAVHRNEWSASHDHCRYHAEEGEAGWRRDQSRPEAVLTREETEGRRAIDSRRPGIRKGRKNTVQQSSREYASLVTRP